MDVKESVSHRAFTACYPTSADVERSLVLANNNLGYAIASLGRDVAVSVYRKYCDDLLDRWLELSKAGLGS